MVDYSRRKFVNMGVSGLVGAAAFSVLPKISLAAVPTDRRLVVMILRGGLDGLAAVPPYADEALLDYRSNIIVAPPGQNNGANDLDGFFGLHPAFSSLNNFWQNRELVVFHAVASPYRSRSHFDAQNVLELGVSRANGAHDGWLNRLLALYGSDASRYYGLAVGNTVPLIMSGGVRVTSWSPDGRNDISEDLIERIGRLYEGNDMFHQAMVEAEEVRAVAEEAVGNYRRAGGGFNGTANAVGQLLRAENGARIAVMDMGGWDTHNGQGTGTGRLANTLGGLDDGIGALRRGLGADWAKTAVIVVTEFGRTVEENGTTGTDHGTGSAAFLVGGAVNGGRVVANWPGLARNQLYQRRDLAPTTDMRGIFKGVLKDLLDIPEHDLHHVIFPRSLTTRAISGLIKSGL